MGEGGRRLEPRRPTVGEARGEAQARLEKARGFESWAGWRPVRAGFEAARLGKAEGSREGVPGGVSRRPAAPIMVCGGASRAAGRAARAMVREGNAAQCAAGAAKPCAHLASTLVRNGHRRLDGDASRLPACGAAHKGCQRLTREASTQRGGLQGENEGVAGREGFEHQRTKPVGPVRRPDRALDDRRVDQDASRKTNILAVPGSGPWSSPPLHNLGSELQDATEPARKKAWVSSNAGLGGAGFNLRMAPWCSARLSVRAAM